MPRLLIPLATLFLFITACAGPSTYRYSDHVLIPPGVKKSSVPQRTATLPISAICPASETGVRLIPAKRSLRIVLQPSLLATHSAGWLTDWTASLEQQHCLP